MNGNSATALKQTKQAFCTKLCLACVGDLWLESVLTPSITRLGITSNSMAKRLSSNLTPRPFRVKHYHSKAWGQEHHGRLHPVRCWPILIAPFPFHTLLRVLSRRTCLAQSDLCHGPPHDKQSAEGGTEAHQQRDPMCYWTWLRYARRQSGP